MSKKILMINAINPNLEVEQRQPHLGLAYLASALRQHFGVDFFEFRIIDRHVETEVQKFSPDFVFISSVTQNFDIATGYAKLIKSHRDVPVLVGGIHISMMPHSLSDCFDIGVIGEGEITAVELMELLLCQPHPSAEMLENIQGIIYRADGQIHFTAPRETIQKMDSIALPARDLLTIPKHAYMFTSRGCPYKCVFCASTRFWPKVRFFSAQYVVNEIRELVTRYEVRLISLYDDLFVANRKRLEEITALLQKDEQLRNVQFTCNCRANLVNEEIVKLLKSMNVRSINLGLESGCEKTLAYLKGGNVTVEQNRNAIEKVRKHGIACSGSFIIGNPQETREDIMETYHFLRKSRLNLTDIYVLTPYPGTPIWDYAESRELVSKDIPWSRLNIDFGHNVQDAIVLSEILSKEEIVTLYKKFLRLRFRKNVIGILRHPYLKDIFIAGLRLLKEQIYWFLKRKKSVKAIG